MIPEAGERLGVGRSRAYQMAKAGVLPTVKVGPRSLRVPEAALEALVAVLAERATETLRPGRASAGDS